MAVAKLAPSTQAVVKKLADSHGAAAKRRCDSDCRGPFRLGDSASECASLDAASMASSSASLGHPLSRALFTGSMAEDMIVLAHRPPRAAAVRARHEHGAAPPTTCAKIAPGQRCRVCPSLASHGVARTPQPVRERPYGATQPPSPGQRVLRKGLRGRSAYHLRQAPIKIHRAIGGLLHRRLPVCVEI